MIVGNPGKTILQAKLLTAYQDELLDKVAKFYHNYHNCQYRVLHKSKIKTSVTFSCTRYQVTAPGVVSNHWTDYKSCKKIIDNHPTLDMKNNCKSCPGKMIVVTTNGTVGFPYFPPPFHLCGNVSSIPMLQLGQQDLHPTFQMISPTVLFKNVFSTENCQAIIDILHNTVKWDKLTGTGGCKKRFYVADLARQTEVSKVVERVMRPLINYVQVMYPSLVCIKLEALKTLPHCPSQYQGHKNKFHLDYLSNYPKIAPAQRPVSVILALDPFVFMYLPHISQKMRDIVHLTVPAGHAIIFPDACLHSGGANNSIKHLYLLFAYMVSSADQLPTFNSIFSSLLKCSLILLIN